MSNILEKIIQTKKEEVEKYIQTSFKKDKQDGTSYKYVYYSNQDFFSSLKKEPQNNTNHKASTPKIIAEVKKASPSRGLIYENFDPVALAKEFNKKGATAISVLTDEKYFQGNLEYINIIKKEVPLPILRKDFIVDESQIIQSKVAGADAILLIVKVFLMLADNKKDKALLLLSHYLDKAKELGLDCLVETHNEQELKIAVSAGANIIGINNRNLEDFTINLETTTQLAKLLPESWRQKNCLVSESGFFSKEDFPENVDAVLIGEGLARKTENIF